MKNYKKSFIGGVVAFFIGTSCCWLSSLAVWIGGAAFLGVVSTFVEGVQGVFIGVGSVLFLVGVYLFVRREKV